MPDVDNLHKPKVSVIVPIYNTGKYVREAVESIMSQTLKELEIILVNDGSTDNSLDIIEELARTDERIAVYSHSNCGVSMTRNEGLAHAHGEYIYFMDSDDLLESDALELCWRKCTENHLDFVIFDATCFNDGNAGNYPTLTYQRTDKLDETACYSGIEALKIQLQHGVFTPSPCLSFIRKSFLDGLQIQFHPGIIHEDQLFTTQLYLNASKVGCIARTFFRRRLRSGSIMTSKFSERNLQGYLAVTRKMIEFRQQAHAPATKQIIDLYLSQMLNAVAWQAHTLGFAIRLRLAITFLCRYKRYVHSRSIAILLVKTITQNKPDNGK